LAHVAADPAVGIGAAGLVAGGEVVTAGVPVGEQVPDDDQDGAGCGDQGFELRSLPMSCRIRTASCSSYAMVTIAQTTPRAAASLAARSGMSDVYRIYDFAAFCLPWSASYFRLCCHRHRSCYR
jgi:hypothetical protein